MKKLKYLGEVLTVNELSQKTSIGKSTLYPNLKNTSHGDNIDSIIKGIKSRGGAREGAGRKGRAGKGKTTRVPIAYLDYINNLMNELDGIIKSSVKKKNRIIEIKLNRSEKKSISIANSGRNIAGKTKVIRIPLLYSIYVNELIMELSGITEGGEKIIEIVVDNLSYKS